MSISLKQKQLFVLLFFKNRENKCHICTLRNKLEIEVGDIVEKTDFFGSFNGDSHSV